MTTPSNPTNQGPSQRSGTNEFQQLSDDITGMVADSKRSSEEAVTAAQAAEKAARDAQAAAEKRAKELSDEIEALRGELLDIKEHGVSVTDLIGRLDGIEGKIERHAPTPEQARMYASDLFAGSKSYEAIQNGTDTRATFKVKTDTITMKSVQSRSVVTSVDDNGETIENIERDITPVAALRPPTGFRDVVSRRATANNAGSVEYVRETRTIRLYDELTSAIIANATAIPVGNAAAFMDDTDITIGTELRTISGINTTTNVLTISTGVTGAHAAGVEVRAEYFSYTGEVDLRPELEANYEEVTLKLEHLSAFTPVSNRMIKTGSEVVDAIDRDLPTKLERNANYLYYYGANGIFLNTDTLEYVWSSGTVGDTKRDAFRRGITQLVAAGAMPSHIFINHFDLEDVELTKDKNDQYIMGISYMHNDGTPVMWRLPVIVDAMLKKGDAVIADMSQCEVRYHPESTVKILDQHKDFGTKGMSVIMIDELEALQIKQPQSVSRISLDTEPT